MKIIDYEDYCFWGLLSGRPYQTHTHTDTKNTKHNTKTPHTHPTPHPNPHQHTQTHTHTHPRPGLDQSHYSTAKPSPSSARHSLALFPCWAIGRAARIR